jgi:hypothetical protein
VVKSVHDKRRFNNFAYITELYVTYTHSQVTIHYSFSF